MEASPLGTEPQIPPTATPRARQAPNPVARVVLVVGILVIVAAVNFMSERGSGPTDRRELPQSVPTQPLPKLPFAAREIEAVRWLNTPDGKPLLLKDLKGKVVLLEFWRFNCSACETAFPMVHALMQKYSKKGLVTIGVHTAVTEEEKEAAQLKKYLKEHDIKYPTAMDNDRRVLEKDYGYPISTPSFLLINRKGNVIEYQSTMNAQEALERELEALFAGDDREEAAKLKNKSAGRQDPSGTPIPAVPMPLSPDPGAPPPAARLLPALKAPIEAKGMPAPAAAPSKR